MKWAPSVVGLYVLLAVPGIVSAEIWRCPQENGTELFTNEPADPTKCEKYVRSTTVSPVPDPTVPAPADSLGQTPTIMFPYAHDGPTPPEYPFPYPGYYDYYYPYNYYPFYGGFLTFRHRPFAFAPGRHHFGAGGHARHGSGGSQHFGSHGRSGHR